MVKVANYYEEFEIAREADLVEINMVLLKQARVWNSRQHVRPEESRKKLVLIDEAKLAFETEESRRVYNKSLDLSLQEPEEMDPNQERFNNFRRWLNSASEYFEKEDYDLAESAIEKALSYRDPDSEEVDSLGFASVIYANIGKNELGLKYVNEAIVLNPTIGWNYRYKYYLVRNTKGFVEEAESLLNRYIAIQEGTQNQELIAEAYDFAAADLYFGFKKKERGEELAKKVIKMNPQSENALKIMAEIKQKQERRLKEKQRIDNNERLQNEIRAVQIPVRPEQDFFYRAAGNVYFIGFVFVFIGTMANVMFANTSFSWFAGLCAVGAVLFFKYRFKKRTLDEINRANATIARLKKEIK